ncbi:unnamed protein product [Anisakis simplex]|uniref:MADF domain-containing protein n=1 Tax=Anisakis simplex TaxID=6269 RepID=A0A0M3J0L9_ANISI|nr:unnamed protein product [Anisakis simplex]
MSTTRSQSDLNPPGEPSFNEILINTVREYPALYSTARRPYDGVDRQLIWKEVAKRIGRDLRDRYRKELKIAIAQNFSQPQKWNHFALLKWLDPHLQGNVPMTANADAHASSSSSLDNMNNLSCLDELFKTHNSSQASASSSLADYAADLMAHAQTSIRSLYPVDTTESDSLDDVKPMLSTIQSVLAATEVKLANDQTAVSSVASNTNHDTDNNMGNAFENVFSIENANGVASKQFDAKQSEMQFNSRSSVSLSSSSSVNNDNINDNQLMSSTGSNDNLSSNKHSSVIDTNRLNQPETIRAHPKMNFQSKKRFFASTSQRN